MLKSVARGLLLVLAALSKAVAEGAEPGAEHRRTPNVLTPVETGLAVFQGQVDTHLFNRDFSQLCVLDTKESDGGYKVKLVPLENVAQQQGVRLARQPRPIRMALIAGSFPYKQQIEEFRAKLGLRSSAVVLQERVVEGGKNLPAFRFLGVNLQRRTLDTSGKPIADYQSQDVDGSYKLWLTNTLSPCESEEPGMAKVLVSGLFMARLRLFRGGREEPNYPSPESRLKLLQKAITNKVAPLPEHCLLRVLDTNIEPETIYQYRLQVRMANPNFGRDDVDKETSKRRELLSDWFQVPGAVTVPSDCICYVVDEKRINKRDKPSEDDPRWEMWERDATPGREVVFQLHRWIEQYSVGNRTDNALLPVGDWAIADRVVVARGEYVSRRLNVDLLMWKYRLDSFVLPCEDYERARGKIRTGIEVDFGQDENKGKETILVDFEGGRRDYQPLQQPGRIEDTSRTEVLMLSPEGKLLARNSAADERSFERLARRTRWRRQVEVLKAR